MKKLITIAMISTVLCISSCKKASSDLAKALHLKSESAGGIVYVGENSKSVYMHLFDKSSGSIMVTEATGGIADIIKNPPTIVVHGGLNYGAPFSNMTIDNDVYSFDNKEMNPDGNAVNIISYKTGPVEKYKGLFNQTTHKVIMNDKDGKFLFGADVYFPSMLDVKTDPYFNVANGRGLLIDSKVGVSIKWNPDPNNPNGIALVLEDREFYETPNPKYIFSLPDNGNFTISSEYLSKFVSNLPKEQQYSNLSASIYRGDIQMITGADGNPYKALVYSEWTVLMQVK